MSATVIDITRYRIDRDNLSWHQEAANRHMANWQAASDRLQVVLADHTPDAPMSEELCDAMDASAGYQAKAVEMAGRIEFLSHAVLDRFEQDILRECRVLTTRCLAETGGLEAGILTARAKMESALSAQITKDPEILNRVINELRRTDARWAHFYQHFEQEKSA